MLKSRAAWGQLVTEWSRGLKPSDVGPLKQGWSLARTRCDEIPDRGQRSESTSYHPPGQEGRAQGKPRKPPSLASQPISQSPIAREAARTGPGYDAASWAGPSVRERRSAGAGGGTGHEGAGIRVSSGA